jgi:hypothetical protein
MIDNTKAIVRNLIKEIKKEELTAVDMTCGKGNDSKFILENLSVKKLYAFDIQEAAREETFKNIRENEDKFVFILDNHKNIDLYIKEKIDLAIYNLGYLPKGDKTITTRYQDVIESLEKLFSLFEKNSTCIITFYPGHPQGKEEAIFVEEYLAGLSQKEFSTLKYSFINQKNNPPFVVRIVKK